MQVIVHGTHVIGFAIVLSLMLTATSSAAPPDVFPESVGGWRAAERVTFDRTNLFQFIDGGAEVYLAYGFRQVWVVTYTRDGAPDIAAEAYDMTVPQDAYGVLSIDLTGEKVAVGAEARYGAGLLRFCKGKWFVRVLALEEAAEARRAVMDLGRHIAGAIKEESPRPRILELLPREGLVPDSTTFLHTRITLNQLYYLSDENLLQLGPQTDAALADYTAPKGEMKLLLVRYPNARRRVEAEAAFVSKYLHGGKVRVRRAAGPMTARVEGGRYVGLASHQAYLALVFEARTAAAARGLLTRASARIPERK